MLLKLLAFKLVQCVLESYQTPIINQDLLFYLFHGKIMLLIEAETATPATMELVQLEFP